MRFDVFENAVFFPLDLLQHDLLLLLPVIKIRLAVAPARLMSGVFASPQQQIARCLIHMLAVIVQVLTARVSDEIARADG